MDWGSEDMTETNDLEYEETETDIEESICSTIDDGFLIDEESPNSEQMVQLRTVVDKDILTVSDRKLTAEAGRGPGVMRTLPVMKIQNCSADRSATAWTGSHTDNPSGVHVKCCKQPVTESVTARASDTEEPLVMKVSTVTMELSELRTSVCGETDTSDIPVNNECFIPDRRRPVKVSPDANAQVVISDNQWNYRDCCFSVCKKSDSVNRLGIGSCWDCLCWLVPSKTDHTGLIYTLKKVVYAPVDWLVGDPVTPCDVIPVYAMMNGNFKGGLSNVMLINKDPVDSRYHQRCVDNRHGPGIHASVCEKPIWERGRFGCSDSTVCDADWSDECSVGLSPVGDVRIEYIGDAFSQGQSTDAAPLTELFDFYTLLHINSDCATGFTSIWTFCITVWDNISGEEFTRRSSDFSVCQTTDGAALVVDRSGVTFRAELCIPWDAPEVVVDIDSAELVSLGSFPDKVGLFGRRKDAAVSRILRGRDSRSVRFLVPDTRGVDRSYYDVTVVDMEDEREPMVVVEDMTRLRELWPAEVFNHMKWYQQDLELMRKSARNSIHRHDRCRADSVEK